MYSLMCFALNQSKLFTIIERKPDMKIDITAAGQSVQDYLDGEITSIQLSQTLGKIVDAAEALDKKQLVSFKYYIEFFEKEGNNLYLHSNKYLKEEVDELGSFVKTLNS